LAGEEAAIFGAKSIKTRWCITYDNGKRVFLIVGADDRCYKERRTPTIFLLGHWRMALSEREAVCFSHLAKPLIKYNTRWLNPF
jgi:hypothetical protein